MESVKEFANAKINLGLNILGKRSDGYHSVLMVMQSIALADEIIISEAQEESGITLSVSNASLSCGSDNLAYKAASLLAAHSGITPNIHISLNKKIFLAAGLAGGSSDAAAVLRGLNKLWQLRMSVTDLKKLGSQLGSDIPFCIAGGSAIAEGRGEIIHQLADLPPVHVILAKPKNIEVSTGLVYGKYDSRRVIRTPNIHRIADNITSGAHAFTNYMANVLETVTIPKYPVIASIKATMLGAGAYAALMSGSGPTVFALAHTHPEAMHIREALSEYDVDTTITTTTGRII
ncbi:MAG: 4-(cytidine 5'-diphospho)-2-C-methyl-D-erythritol kinase [Acidaminococcaceae bacterium]|nr:4-(cytidine 5'-diphospho)-2-C-methyl-D-erythritol kinase [Acidaminococcaceae bacterium]